MVTSDGLEPAVRTEAEVVIVAASRDQADILRRQAEQLVKRSGRQVGKFGWRIGDDLFEIKSGYREIRLGEARIRVMSADAATGDGTIPTLALVDELHRHRSMELYGVLADGLEAPAPAGGKRGSLRDFARFCSQLTLDTGERMTLEEHERKMLRLYFAGVRELVIIIGKKNGKTTLLAALALYHLRTGTPVRQMITISTAGLSTESPLGQLRAKAHQLETFSRHGVVNTASEPDGSFAWLEWCLDPEDDLTNMRLVKRANPASWHTVGSLRRRHGSPSMTPGRWARFACGVWTGSEEPWITARTWDQLKVDIGQVELGEPVYCSVSYGANPAIALAAARDLSDDDSELAAAVRVFVGDGDPDPDVVETQLRELAKLYRLEEVTYDRVEFLRSAQLLEDDGLPMVELPHSPERLSIVSQTLDRLVKLKRIRHDGDAELREQIVGAITKERNEAGGS